MSEKNETDHSVNASEPQKDRVGDIIRKERITRRITVETIAKDLKLNVKYIKSLEASEYSELPADPYIRVYFRSLAKYLSLDSEEILKKFYEERGSGDDHLKKDASTKLVISVKEKKPRKNPTLVITIVLIIFLTFFYFFANKKGWITSPPSIQEKQTDTTAVQSTPTNDSVTDSLLDDSLFSDLPAPVEDRDTIKAAKPDTISTNVSKKTLRLKIDVSNDSVWAQVFSDGKSWKSIITKGAPKEFTANDSFNVHMANNPSVSYTFNGMPLKIKGNSVVFFKIDSSGIPIAWGNNKWNNVFKNRL